MKQPFLNKLSQVGNKSLVWIGMVPMLMGAVVMLVSADIIPPQDPPGITTRYLTGLFGLMFFSVGVFLSMADERLQVFRETWWFKLITYTSTFTFPAIFLFIFNWVSFGPGQREFSLSISIPFLAAYTDNANELFGRIFFAIPTLIMDFVVIGVIFAAVKRTLTQWINAADESDKNT